MPVSAAAVSFQGLQERNEVANLIAFEAKLRHGRMSGDDALRQGLFQHPDGIALVQGSERWGDFQWTRTDLVDGVTLRTVSQRETLALLDVGGDRRNIAGS